MPNNTTNVIRFGGTLDALEEVREALGTSETRLDFNRLVPMPESVSSAEESTTTDHGRALLTGDDEYFARMLAYPWVIQRGIKNVNELKAWVETEFPEARDQALVHIDNVKQYGYATWLDFGRAKWGTKWNAYSISEWKTGSIRDWNAEHRGERDVDGDTPRLHYCQLEFETAWSFPYPIIDEMNKLAEKLGVTFDHWFADEGGDDWKFDPRTNTAGYVLRHNVESEISWADD